VYDSTVLRTGTRGKQAKQSPRRGESGAALFSGVHVLPMYYSGTKRAFLPTS
jgi:hypothetical protein